MELHRYLIKNLDLSALRSPRGWRPWARLDDSTWRLTQGLLLFTESPWPRLLCEQRGPFPPQPAQSAWAFMPAATLNKVVIALPLTNPGSDSPFFSCLQRLSSVITSGQVLGKVERFLSGIFVFPMVCPSWARFKPFKKQLFLLLSLIASNFTGNC